MKKIILFLAILFGTFQVKAQETANDYTVELARMFAKDMLHLNGKPYLSPMVVAVNAASNARFFNDAYVPQEVDKPYFKLSANAMVGFVPNEMMLYKPIMPTQQITTEGASEYFEYNLLNGEIEIQDTAGLIHYAFLGLLYDGVTTGAIDVPDSASTVLGNVNVPFVLPQDTLINLMRNLRVNIPFVGDTTVFNLLPPDMQDSLIASLKLFPEKYNLPPGVDMSTVFAAVPQLTVGSLWGTEATVRVIPPITWDKNVGKFAFWGLALKHSISQYFPERYFDLAIQTAYQGTYLENKVGVYKSYLEANASIFNINLHASKSFENIIDIFTGISYEYIDITSDYTYYLPVEVQWQLGLLEFDSFDPTPGHPGDQKPNLVKFDLSDSNIKWVIGAKRSIGPVDIFADFSLSEFNIFSGGLQYNF